MTIDPGANSPGAVYRLRIRTKNESDLWVVKTQAVMPYVRIITCCHGDCCEHEAHGCRGEFRNSLFVTKKDISVF